MTRNITQNRKIASRAIISALVLWLAFSGMAAAEQFYVNEGGWWRDGGAFNASGTPIQAAVDAAAAGDAIYVYNGTYYEGGGVSISKERITLQGEDANTTTIHGRWTAEGVVDLSGNYVNVSGFTVTGGTSCGSGIRVRGSNCLVSNNIANSNYHGIYLYYSSGNTIANNIANSNTLGIYLQHSSCNRIANNIIVNSSFFGIYMYKSSNTNHIIGNTADENRDGIYLFTSSTDNIITENNISNNRRYGIYLDYTADNDIYHNNFIDNDKQAYDHHGFNEWDKGASVGGNYWSDHVCSGNPSNGTEPYNGIDTNAGAVDTYPFKEPDGWATAPPLFTPADAAIALQIAADSRPPDLRWDVSGDKRVTSLDALMILQAAAGKVDLS